MPYVNIVNERGYLPESEPHAFATIEEARVDALAAIHDLHNTQPIEEEALAKLVAEVAALPEHGGVVGPMPDGYMIDVQYKTWLELLALTRVVLVGQYPMEHEKRLILEDYNR